MNRIQNLFNRKNKNILSIYFCSGHPNPDNTIQTICQLEQAGADMVEIGIPFSDPMADGPIIQQASACSLRNGTTLHSIFIQLKEVRKLTQLPLVMMGYLNPIIQYGFENFCKDCQACGIDGVIIPDLPLKEYRKEFHDIATQYGLSFIMLITPETSEERIREIDRHTNSFIYIVSSAATTGVRENFGYSEEKYFKYVSKLKLRNPTLIGFGISNAETFRLANRYANGCIVGSRFVTMLDEEQGNAMQAFQRLKKVLRL